MLLNPGLLAMLFLALLVLLLLLLLLVVVVAAWCRRLPKGLAAMADPKAAERGPKP
jgi:hypothetical protein